MSDSVDLARAEDETLDILSRALAPPPVEPSPESILLLRNAVASLLPPRPSRRQRVADWVAGPVVGLRRKPWVAVGAVFGIAVIGTGSAFAAGVPVPPPLREAASALHLPVTPQSVVDVHQAASALRQSLGRTPSDPGATARAAEELTTRYRGLDPSQQAEASASTRSLLAEACQRLSPTIGSDHARPPGLATLWPGCRADQAGLGRTTGTPRSTVAGGPAQTVPGSGSGSGSGIHGTPPPHGTPPHGNSGNTTTPPSPSRTGGAHPGPPAGGTPPRAGGGADGSQGRTDGTGQAHTPTGTRPGSSGTWEVTTGPRPGPTGGSPHPR
jgi:hypothetical protein